MLARAIDGAQLFAVLRCHDGVAQEQLRIAENRVERSANLVGHARQKKALRPAGAFGLGLGFFECGIGALELVGAYRDPLFELGSKFPKLVADALVLTDLASDDQDGGSAAVFDHAQAGIEDQTGLVRANAEKLERDMAEPADRLETGGLHVGMDARHVEVGELSMQKLASAMVQLAASCLVDVHDAPIEIENQERVGEAVEQHFVAALG